MQAQPRTLSEIAMSQSPEGSTSDFHQKETTTPSATTNYGSQSPEGSTSDFHRRFVIGENLLHLVSIPRRVHIRFPHSDGLHPLVSETRKCLNPPKGPHPISTTKPICFPEPTPIVSQSPEGSTSDFHLVKCIEAVEQSKKKSQSPEGSTSDFHSHGPAKTHESPSWLSQSPEGSTSDFHPAHSSRRLDAVKLSQSPEGSTSDFHETMGV